MTELTEVFYIFFVSSVLAFFGVVTRYCYKTKCKKIECCGIHIIRDVEEERDDELNNRRRENSSSTITITSKPTNPQINSIQL